VRDLWEGRGGQRVVLGLQCSPMLLHVCGRRRRFSTPVLADYVPPVRPYPEDILSCEWYYS
jgi:hypothetical protein